MAAALAVACDVSTGVAGESLFSRVYTTDAEPAGRTEVEQLARSRSGRSMGTCRAVDGRTGIEIGPAHRFAPNWFAGLGARTHNEHGRFVNFQHSVASTGPSIHVAGERCWATLGCLRQVYGSPSGIDENGTPVGHRLFLRSHERNEVTLKVAYTF